MMQLQIVPGVNDLCRFTCGGFLRLLYLSVMVYGKPEVVKRVERAEAGGDGVISEKQKRADDGEHPALVLGGGINAAAVGVDAADLCVGPADADDQHAHRQDQPETSATREQQRDSQHIQ